MSSAGANDSIRPSRSTMPSTTAGTRIERPREQRVRLGLADRHQPHRRRHRRREPRVGERLDRSPPLDAGDGARAGKRDRQRRAEPARARERHRAVVEARVRDAAPATWSAAAAPSRGSSAARSTTDAARRAPRRVRSARRQSPSRERRPRLPHRRPFRAGRSSRRGTLHPRAQIADVGRSLASHGRRLEAVGVRESSDRKQAVAQVEGSRRKVQWSGVSERDFRHGSSGSAVRSECRSQC